MSLRTIILTENQGQVGRSLGTMIQTVEPGKGGEGSSVSRKNDSNCRTRGGEGSFVSRKTVEPGRGGGGSSVSRNNDCNLEPRRAGRGHLSLGTIIL